MAGLPISQSGQYIERAGYFEFAGEHLYSVVHQVTDPIAQVLLVGPFAAERHFGYVPWVRWARYLAARRIDVLRFDYRGVGESTGVFEEMSFGDWADDVEFFAGLLKRQRPDLPLILHGLELGALLASKTFEKQLGDALLLWAAPGSGNDVLRAALSRRVAVDHTFKGANMGKRWPDYVRLLEANQPVDVEGYRWSTNLWRDSFTMNLPLGKDEAANIAWAGGRPVKRVQLTNSAAPLIKGAWLAYVTLNPDLSGLFTENFDWIAQLPAVHRSTAA